MNKTQRIVLIVGAVLLLIICLYVPWQQTFQTRGTSQILKPAGYHFIFTPPPVHPKPGFSKFTYGMVIDFHRWFIGLLAVVGATTIIFYSLKKNP